MSSRLCPPHPGPGPRANQVEGSPRSRRPALPGPALRRLRGERGPALRALPSGPAWRGAFPSSAPEREPEGRLCTPRPRCQAGLSSDPGEFTFFFFLNKVLSGDPSLRACLLGTRQVARFAELHVCIELAG